MSVALSCSPYEGSTTTRVGFGAQLRPWHERLEAAPTRYRVVVLTSWDRGVKIDAVSPHNSGVINTVIAPTRGMRYKNFIHLGI